MWLKLDVRIWIKTKTKNWTFSCSDPILEIKPKNNPSTTVTHPSLLQFTNVTMMFIVGFSGFWRDFSLRFTE